jgi:hypothetical protein
VKTLLIAHVGSSLGGNLRHTQPLIDELSWLSELQ